MIERLFLHLRLGKYFLVILYFLSSLKVLIWVLVEGIHFS
jgi:hypothetical protein